MIMYALCIKIPDFLVSDIKFLVIFLYIIQFIELYRSIE
jgi:hypothetical protein